MLAKINKYYPQILLAILAFSFFTRVYNLDKPATYVFDEVYHAVTAKLIANNDIRAYEWNNPPPEPDTAVDWLHPPLAKYTQALSMKLLAQNSFGWRFSSAIFGVIVILLVAQLSMELFNSKSLALLAAFIASLDGLILTMSRIAMNDIHVTTFILLTLILYLKYLKNGRKDKKQLVYTGLVAGLAISSKWSGFFVIAIVAHFEVVYTLIEITKKNKLKTVKQRALRVLQRGSLAIFALILVPILVYVLSYSHMFFLGKDLSHLVEMHKQIWHYQTHLRATHPASSKPYQWFLNLKPVWIAVDHSHKGLRGDIYAFGNIAIFWIGDIFIFATMIYLALLARLKKKSKAVKTEIHALVFLLSSYFIIWLPWQLSPRIMFFYHYLPAVPLLVINLAFWTNKLFTTKKHQVVYKSVAMTILACIIITFIVWYPHWTNIPVPIAWKNTVYFALPSWKQ